MDTVVGIGQVWIEWLRKLKVFSKLSISYEVLSDCLEVCLCWYIRSLMVIMSYSATLERGNSWRTYDLACATPQSVVALSTAANYFNNQEAPAII
jgi:hypothetical protein